MENDKRECEALLIARACFHEECACEQDYHEAMEEDSIDYQFHKRTFVYCMFPYENHCRQD